MPCFFEKNIFAPRMLSFSSKAVQKWPFQAKKNSKIQKIDFPSKCLEVDYMIVDGFQSVLGHPEHVLEPLWTL